MRFCRQATLTAYDAALYLSWPALYLYYFCRSLTDGRYRGNYLNRMGLRLPDPLLSCPARVWIHALSVGETLSSIPLIAELKLKRPALEVVFSTSTETGMSIAVERLKGLVDNFFHLPHDFPWTVDRLVKRVRPSLFVLIETDFWPNLLWRLNRESVPAVLVNGRMSPGSFRRYSRLGALAGIIFGGFDLILAQTELDKARFISLCGLAERVMATGNLKFESSIPRVSESEIASIRADIGLDAGRPVWVAGSTHEGEEQILLRIHRDLCAKIPNVLLIIAPRKIHRGAEIAALAGRLGLDCGIRSKAENAEGKAVYILDTLGELARMYAICDIGFLGGSFAPIGGHNPLEVVAQGRPACWGPHFFNFAEIERELLQAGCAIRVSSESELKDFLEEIFSDTRRIAKMMKAAEKFAGLQRNTAKRIASALLEKIG
ncbi:MAG: 3-deoxy-D-manno-octulosonic acid transferase [Syntrophobacteraceae bacterium]|jgi:3-deoxy-D-manno-octulosonic-acid transferase